MERGFNLCTRRNQRGCRTTLLTINFVVEDDMSTPIRHGIRV